MRPRTGYIVGTWMQTENAMKKRTPTVTVIAMPKTVKDWLDKMGIRAIQAYLDHKASLVPSDQWGHKGSHPRPSSLS
jgi:hypothetical protein